MKRFLLFLITSAILLSNFQQSKSQNLSLNYAFGTKANYFESVLDLYKFDKYGRNLLLAVYNFNAPGNKSMSNAFFEYSRYVTLPILNNKIEATLQYSDAFGIGYANGQTWMAGFSYPIPIKNFTLNTDILLKKSYNHDFGIKFRFAWWERYLNDKLCFAGYFDIWTTEKYNIFNERDGLKLVYHTEPALWYYVWDKLSLGAKFEFSYNLDPTVSGFVYRPKLGARWSF